MAKGINIYPAHISRARDLVITILEDEFGIKEPDAGSYYDEHINKHFSKLRDNCFLFAESPYVDKVYRDSYYHYFSSKHFQYKRDCVRISIFEGEITYDDLRDRNKKNDLQDRYRGFIIIRPCDPFFIGRSVISPKALKEDNFLICSAGMAATVYGVKFIVDGFPYSSQDTETMSCAETTLWAIMEYFSTRYSEYRPALPSRILNTLNKVSVERQVPSKGLDVVQISYALKEFGFGTRIYSRKDFTDKVFEKIISCYIESGIPVITAADNQEEVQKAGSNISFIGHAMICVGHDEITDSHYAAIPLTIFTDNEANKRIIEAIKNKNIELYDYDEIKKNFIFIDDNCPVYQKATLEKPCEHYGGEWQKCKINHIIVPLYKRIYLEAYEAKNYVRNFLLIGPYPVQDNQEILLRFFLTSNRSYKNKLSTNDTLTADIKNKILASPLPKFIWVAELSTRALIKQKMANGVIILDATEAVTDYHKPLVMAAYGGNVIEPDEENGELKQKPIPLADFFIYENNLTRK